MLARYASPPLSYEPVLSCFQTIPATIQKAPENINGSSYTWGTQVTEMSMCYQKASKQTKPRVQANGEMHKFSPDIFFPLFHVV